MKGPNNRFLLDADSQDRWKKRLGAALREIGTNDTKAAENILREMDPDTKRPNIGSMKTVLSKFKGGQASSLKLWFEGAKRPHLEAFARLHNKSPAIFEQWLEESRGAKPEKVDVAWHSAFPFIESGKISVPARFTLKGQSFSATDLAKSLMPAPPTEEERKKTEGSKKERYGTSHKTKSPSTGHLRECIKGRLILEGLPGSGLKTASRQLKLALEKRQIELIQQYGKEAVGNAIDFEIITWEQSLYRPEADAGPIVCRYRSYAESNSIEFFEDLQPRFVFSHEERLPKGAQKIEIEPWEIEQAQSLIRQLVEHGNLPGDQQRHLTDFGNRLAKNAALIGPQRSPERIISLLGEVAQGQAPLSAKDTRDRLSNAAWKAAQHLDTSGALACFSPELIEDIWSAWLLKETRTEVYNSQYASLDWAFIPNNVVQKFLESVAEGHRTPSDPIGRLTGLLDKLNGPKVNKEERLALVKELRQAVLTPRGDALLHGLVEGGLLRKEKRCLRFKGEAQIGWVPSDRIMANLWAVRGLLRRLPNWMNDGWERLFDSRWRRILNEVAAAGMPWKDMESLLKDCPKWAKIDRSRWVVAFAAFSPEMIPSDVLIPAWATTVFAVLSGVHSPWLGKSFESDPTLCFPEDCKALRLISEKYRDVLPELTEYSEGGFRPASGEEMGTYGLEVPSCLPSVKEIAPELFLSRNSDGGDALEKVVDLVPPVLRHRIEAWRRIPVAGASPSDAQVDILDAGIEDDEHGFQQWKSRRPVLWQLRWLAPRQYFPWDLHVIREAESCLQYFQFRRWLPEFDSAVEQLLGEAEQGSALARWMIAGAIVPSDLNRSFWSYIWGRLPLKVRLYRIEQLPKTRELWSRVVELGQEACRAWTKTPAKVEKKTSNDLDLDFYLRGPPKPKKELKPGEVPSPRDLDNSFLERIKAMEGRGTAFPNLAIPADELEALLKLYRLLPEEGVIAVLRQNQDWNLDDFAARQIHWSWKNPFQSRYFCLKLAENVSGSEWLRQQSNIGIDLLSQEEFKIHVNFNWFYPLTNIRGTDVSLRSPLEVNWQTHPMNHLLNILKKKERWALEASRALCRLGELEALEMRWHHPEKWVPSQALEQALQTLILLRWWLLNPPPITSHLSSIFFVDENGEASPECRSLNEAKQAVSMFQAAFDGLKVHPSKDAHLPGGGLLRHRGSSKSLTLRQVEQLEGISPHLLALSETLWKEHQEIMAVLGWSDAKSIARVLLQSPLLFESPLIRDEVCEKVYSDLSISNRTQLEVIPSRVEHNLPRVTRLTFMIERLPEELKLVAKHLETKGLPESGSKLRRWLSELVTHFAPNQWEKWDGVSYWRRDLGEWAFKAQVRLGEPGILRKWVDGFGRPEQDSWGYEDPPGVFGPHRKRILESLVQDEPTILDAAWALDGLTDVQRLTLVKFSGGLKDGHRPWVFDFVLNLDDEVKQRKLIQSFKGDPRCIPILEYRLERCRQGRQHASWAIDLHKHKPFNKHFRETLRYWSLEDPEPFRGGESFIPWPAPHFTGDSPIEWLLSDEKGAEKRRKRTSRDDSIGQSFGRESFREGRYDARLPISAGGVDALVEAMLAWCRHISGNAKFQREINWTKDGVRRLLTLFLILPAIRPIKEGFSLWSSFGYSTFLVTKEEVPYKVAGPLFEAAEELGLYDMLSIFESNPPTPQPGDCEVFPFQTASSEPQTILDRPSMIRMWLKGRHRYQNWQSTVDKPDIGNRLMEGYERLISDTPEDFYTLLYLETVLIEKDKYTETVLDNLEAHLKLCLQVPSQDSLWQHMGETEVRIDSRFEGWKYKKEVFRFSNIGNSFERGMELLWTLRPARAAALEVEALVKNPGQAHERLGRLGVLKRLHGTCVPSVERILRQQNPDES